MELQLACTHTESYFRGGVVRMEGSLAKALNNTSFYITRKKKGK